MKNGLTLEALQSTLARLSRERDHYAELSESEAEDAFFSSCNVVNGTEMMILAAERLIEKERLYAGGEQSALRERTDG